MPQRPVHEPVPFIEAFLRTDEAAIQSRAACVLLLGAQLGSEPLASRVHAALRGEAGADRPPAADVLPLEVPELHATGERLTHESVRRLVAAELGVAWEELLEEPGRARLAELAERVDEHPVPHHAAELFEGCLHHEDELLRTAAAIAYLNVSAEPEVLAARLVAATHSENELVRELAAVALARYAPDHPRIAELQAPGPPPAPGEPAHTSLLVHGSFARANRWWQPGGDFHEYLRGDVRPDLYGDADRFAWSGGYSDRARALAAADLVAWAEERDLQGLDLFAHSHGGNVAMLASQKGLAVGRLALLSCPAHVHKYLPDFDRVGDVVALGVRLDLVILIDGGRQRFRHPRIREEVLPIWFDHSATHDPATWRRHDLPSLL